MRAETWPVRSVLLAVLVVLLIGTSAYNTVLNNAYAYGATLHDSTIFATIMWRSGWLLMPAPALGTESFFNTHITPIHYLPNLFSYWFPGDRITYYALVYGAVYGALGFAAFLVIRGVAPPRSGNWLGLFAAIALFCSLPVFQGQWEPHIEVASPLFAILMFRAWQLRDYRQSLLWLLLNAAIREDLGAVYAIPLALLAVVQYLANRGRDPDLAREQLRWGVILCGISIAWSIGAFAIQKRYFAQFDVMHQFYFDRDNPLGHLTGALLSQRAHAILVNEQGIWLPLLVLVVAGGAFRDYELLVGSVAFLPYALINFLSKMELSATLNSYKAFPFAVVMLWPAIVALRRPTRAKRYLLLQLAVLACGIFSVSDGRLYFNGPWGLSAAAGRWFAQPLTEHAEDYRAFGVRLGEPGALGTVRASQGVIALYPYSFAPWYLSDYQDLNLADVPKYDSFIWFVGDRDAAIAQNILARAGDRDRYRVIGTKIELATRLPPDRLSIFAGLLEKLPLEARPAVPR